MDMTIYERMTKEKLQRLKQGTDRGLISLLMSEICKDGRPMEDKDAVVRLTQIKKTCARNIEIFKDTVLLEGADEDLFASKIDEENDFREMINEYLPQGAEPEDVEQALAVLNLPRTIRSIGEVMKHLKKSFEVVDGTMVRNLLLTGDK